MNNNRPRNIRKRGTLAILAIALYGFYPAKLFAGDTAYGLGYSSEYSSNITHVPVNEQKDWVNSVMAGVGYAENTPDLVARVLSEAQFNKYQHVFGNETLFNLDSSAVWTVSPQRFNWSLQDVYRQLPIDPTVTETPANRENVNVVSTGPDFLLHLSPDQTLALGARYGNFYTSSTNTDNNNASGYTRWLYQSTPRTTYSLNYEALDVNYKDDVANIDYKQQNLYFKADTRPSRSEYILDLGTSNISRDRHSGERDGMGRLSWVREINPETNMGASAEADSSNTGADVLAASTTAAGPVPVPVPIVQPGAVTSDVYRTKRAQVFYTHHSSQFGTSLLVFDQNVDYQTLPDNNRQTGSNLLFSYYYSETFSTTLFGDYLKTKYTILVRRDIDRDAGLRFAYRVSRDILMTLEGRRTVRASTDPTSPFTDNRVLFTVLYSSGPVFQALSTR